MSEEKKGLKLTNEEKFYFNSLEKDRAMLSEQLKATIAEIAAAIERAAARLGITPEELRTSQISPDGTVTPPNKKKPVAAGIAGKAARRSRLSKKR